jgi:hypothetical protein
MRGGIPGGVMEQSKVVEEVSPPEPRLDVSELLSGFQVEKRMPRHDAPEWVFDDVFIRELFPRDQRKWSRPVLNRAGTLYWYWRCNLTQAEIAERLGITTRAVERILQRTAGRAQVLIAKKEGAEGQDDNLCGCEPRKDATLTRFENLRKVLFSPSESLACEDAF